MNLKEKKNVNEKKRLFKEISLINNMPGFLSSTVREPYSPRYNGGPNWSLPPPPKVPQCNYMRWCSEGGH